MVLELEFAVKISVQKLPLYYVDSRNQMDVCSYIIILEVLCHFLLRPKVTMGAQRDPLLLLTHLEFVLTQVLQLLMSTIIRQFPHAVIQILGTVRARLEEQYAQVSDSAVQVQYETGF